MGIEKGKRVKWVWLHNGSGGGSRGWITFLILFLFFPLHLPSFSGFVGFIPSHSPLTLKAATTFCIVCCFNVNGKFAHLINSSWPMASKSKKVNGYKYYNNKMYTEVTVFQVCMLHCTEMSELYFHSGNESKRDDHNYIIPPAFLSAQLNVFSSPFYLTEAIIWYTNKVHYCIQLGAVKTKFIDHIQIFIIISTYWSSSSSFRVME